jgi:hypothetical protein
MSIGGLRYGFDWRGLGGTLAAHDEPILGPATQVKRFLHQRVDDEQASAMFLIPVRQLDSYRPFKSRCMVGHLQLNPWTAARNVELHRTFAPASFGIRNGIIARFDQSRLASQDVAGSDSFLA